jgi:Holliday junction resolvase RusA-like endonuclease
VTRKVFESIHIDGEIHSSKNSRQFSIRQKSLFKSAAAKADEQTMAWQLNAQRAEWENMTHGAKYPYRVQFYFRRKTRARWDFTNLVQGVADAMVKAGYIQDDDVSHFIPGYAGHIVDRLSPGVSFWIKDKK